MKIGIVTKLDFVSLSAAYYLDTCVHCHGRESDRRYHDEEGRCHQRRVVFVATGTTFENRGTES